MGTEDRRTAGTFKIVYGLLEPLPTINPEKKPPEVLLSVNILTSLDLAIRASQTLPHATVATATAACYSDTRTMRRTTEPLSSAHAM